MIRSTRIPKGNLMRSNKKSIQALISEAKHISDDDNDQPVGKKILTTSKVAQ